MTKALLNVLKGDKPAIPPMWLMRQAGRYLPEYRTLRAQKGGFLALATDPDAAAEVTVQPIRRFGFDGAILFSDILMVPWARGASLPLMPRAPRSMRSGSMKRSIPSGPMRYCLRVCRCRGISIRLCSRRGANHWRAASIGCLRHSAIGHTSSTWDMASGSTPRSRMSSSSWRECGRNIELFSFGAGLSGQARPERDGLGLE
ncbi:hypothetical protein JMG10_46125 [Nostoc ellipsosporum NOK]|nr:hypothetical protein [Nostoc ellipsosporum NOK]